MKKIVIVCPHPKDVAPGQRLKYEQYIESWEKNGFVRKSKYQNLEKIIDDLEKRLSESRKNCGIVTVKTIGKNSYIRQ